MAGGRPMRILHVVESFAAGTMQVVRLLAERLAAQGHELTVAYGTRPETPADVRGQVGAVVALVQLPWDRTPRGQLRTGRALRRLARELQPDVVHLHSSFAGAVGSAAIPRGMPIVYSPHAYSFTRGSDAPARRAAFLLAERLIARRVSAVGAVSGDEGRLARDRVGAKHVVVVANGIAELDPGGLPPATVRTGRPAVVAMGRIGAQRLPAETARVLAGVADVADVAWVGGALPGSGDDRPLLDAGVTVTGWLDREAALARMAGATAYLHWSAWDGQSLAILEAMARDVCVVASDIAPNRELLEPEQVCGREEEAVALLRRILTDPVCRTAMLAGQARRREQHSARGMVDGWAALYRSLAGNERVAP